MYKRILVPLDGSTLSEAVLPHAQNLAQTTGAELVLLHVIVTPVEKFSVPLTLADIQKIEAESKLYLKSVCSKLEKENLRVTFLVREGSVAETILEVAASMEADAIAMSTHGRTGVKRWLLGSVADKVVRMSPLPVLLIRPRE